MPDKQKVTLYLSDELHRQFKVRSAIDGETMSSMAQRAIEFYLNHAEVVESSSEAYDQTYRVHSCPNCSASVTLQDSKLSLVGKDSSSFLDGLESIGRISKLSQDAAVSVSKRDSKRSDEGELITC